MFWITVISVLCVIFYYKAIRPLSYWKDRNIPYLKPYPIVGTSVSVIFQRLSFFDYVIELYRKFPMERYFGGHEFNTPTLYVKDVELIKQMAVKDFDHFTDHNQFPSFELEPWTSKNLFNLRGQKWRDMRGTLSPSFTSSKMKMMFSLLLDCAEQLTNHFEKQIVSVQEVELKDVFTRFTNDAIATTAFGVTCNSLDNKNNEFYLMGKNLTETTRFRLLLLIFYTICPTLAKLMRLRIIPKTVGNFFQQIIMETIQLREREGLIRRDMIHLLLEARKGKITKEESQLPDTGFATVDESPAMSSDRRSRMKLSDEDIVAQALIFFFAGFDTSSSVMCFIAYELATNPEIHKKLQTEVDETLEECNGKITYEALNKMKYMDMVVSETLRKWTPGFINDRICVKDYTIEPAHAWENPLLIEKGTLIVFPVIGIHRDPEYYPNPDVFDPERFSDENKHKINLSAYYPFGVGPRSCIASRFALMENKLLMFYLLSKFDIVCTNKTPNPLKIDKTTVSFVVEGGFWLGLKKRQRS